MINSSGEIQFEDVIVQFGEEVAPFVVLQDCTFKLEKGKFNILVGTSGSGKSTLINVVAGYEFPSRGRVSIDGKEITGPGRDRLVVFQETALFPWMTIMDNILFGPTVQHERRGESKKKALDLLNKVGLQGFADRYPIQLSGGMQRRAELARALINNPKIMLMDEPFRGLDAMTRQLMQEYTSRLFEETNITQLFVTSELEEAIYLADKIYILSCRPSKVIKIIDVNLPRPREYSILTSRDYSNIKFEALEILYEEAKKSFASGGMSGADLVEAFDKRKETLT
jgi:NitT/TauT family transport system ATP-binding protein